MSAESSKRNILRKGRGAGSGKVKAKHGQGVDDGSTYDDVMDPGDPCYDLQEQDDNYILVSGDADQAMLSSSPGQGGGGSSWGSRGSGGGSYGEKGFLGRQAQGASPPRRSYDPNLQRVVIVARKIHGVFHLGVVRLGEVLRSRVRVNARVRGRL